MQRFFTLSSEDKKELLSITSRLKNVSESTLQPNVIEADLSPEQVDFAVTENLPLEFFQFFEIDGLKSEMQNEVQKIASTIPEAA